MNHPKQNSAFGGGSPPKDAYKSAGEHVTHSIADIAGVMVTTALRIPDVDRAREELAALVKEAFMSKFGAPIATLDIEIGSEELELEETKSEHKKAKSDLAQTPARLAACQVNRGLDEDERIEVPLSKWQARHKVEAFFLTLMILTAIAASLLTAKANITGSGLQVFLDNPLLAWTMASLAPLSGFAIKTIYESLPSGWAIATFKFSLITSMIVSVALWLVLYAQSYDGLSTQTSIGGLFDEPSLWDQILDTAFVAVSLTTEILIGAVLALRLTIIAGCYSPDYTHLNPEHIRLTKLVEQLRTRIRELVASLAEKVGQRAQYTHSLNLQTRTWTLAHDGRRGASSAPIL